jgi:hypothetical protein
VFFVIPVLAMMIPLIGFAPRIDRWLHVRRIDQLHRALGDIQHELVQSHDAARSTECEPRIAAIESAMHSLKVARRFDADFTCGWRAKTSHACDQQASRLLSAHLGELAEPVPGGHATVHGRASRSGTRVAGLDTVRLQEGQSRQLFSGREGQRSVSLSG